MIQTLKSLLFDDAGQEANNPVPEVNEFQLATAVVLLEIAMADDEFTQDERARIEQTLQTRFGMASEDAARLIVAAQKARDNSRDLWHFTNIINQTCSVEEKQKIIDEVWHVVFADGSMDGHENYLAHQMAKLFNLTHGQLIDSKVRVLAELRGA